MKQEQYQRALEINEELKGLMVAKEEGRYGKHRLCFQTYTMNTCCTNSWDTWAEYKMDGIRKILDKHEKMIRQEIDEKIESLKKEIEEL